VKCLIKGFFFDFEVVIFYELKNMRAPPEKSEPRKSEKRGNYSCINYEKLHIKKSKSAEV